MWALGSRSGFGFLFSVQKEAIARVLSRGHDLIYIFKSRLWPLYGEWIVERLWQRLWRLGPGWCWGSGKEVFGFGMCFGVGRR